MLESTKCGSASKQLIALTVPMKVSEGTKTSSFFFTPMALREINNSWVQFIKATEYFAFVNFFISFSNLTTKFP